MNHTVILDPGHGGHQAAGKSTPFGVRGPDGQLEKDVTLRLAERVAAHLGRGAVLTRRSDENLSLAERVAVARRHGARVFVSLHASGQHGSEAWVHPHAGAPSRELARGIQRALGRIGGLDCGLHTGELAVLHPSAHSPGVAACLVEVDALSDPAGAQRLGDPRGLDRMGRALAEAIRTHLARVGGATANLEDSVCRWVPEGEAAATDSSSDEPYATGESYALSTRTPVELAGDSVPLARRWIDGALDNLRGLRDLAERSGYPVDSRAEYADTHFHIGDASGDTLKINLLDKAIGVYELMLKVLDDTKKWFQDGPGPGFADAPVGGYHYPGYKITFRADYLRCGPNCRAAMIVHECAHFVGGLNEIGHYAREIPPPNGAPDGGHSKNYRDLSPEDAVRNAYTYAAFAIHATTGTDSRWGALDITK